ncbi:hypothetical protein AK88_04932 [Plasmodium fragile]|uniref:Schizont-infected cell agglutination C-terminal domain-containing protein n=1 Tax=Plasmodium fragile TaxID=5857 RepID=A0A0D9QEL1_PLAFR|nr:uncharacterized protein AK88_04932 [Plasmodium fragile]KJP85429.1 hypothetical protein AK88_04932 [Plasmodium fragile]
MAAHLVDVMAEWAIKRELGTQQQLDSALWADMENVLKDFVPYMEQIEDTLDLYATSCGDEGWTRRGDRHKGIKYRGHTVADVMKCRLMVGALFFIAPWRSTQPPDTDESQNDKEMKAIMRCTVANVFAYILAAIPCGFQWLGPDQAWYIMKEMGGTGGVETSISDGTCRLDEYTDTKVGTRDLQSAIEKWLQQSTPIRNRMQAIKNNPKCKMDWATYKNNLEARGQHADLSSIFQQDDMNTLVKTQMQDMFKTITTTVRKKVDKARNKTGSSGGVGDSDVESADEEEAGKKNAQEDMKERTAEEAKKKQTEGSDSKKEKDKASPQEPQGGGTQTTHPSTTPSPTGAGTGGTPGTQSQPTGPVGVGRADTPPADTIPGAGPVPQPAPAAPPRGSPPGPTADGSEKAGKKSKSTCGVTTGSHEKDVGEGTLTVSVSFASPSDPKDCSGSNSPETPECSTPLDSKVHLGREKPRSERNQTSNESNRQSDGSGAGARDDVVDGGKVSTGDDPPPLNPPKPKPNPNPNQSGSSGGEQGPPAVPGSGNTTSLDPSPQGPNGQMPSPLEPVSEPKNKDPTALDKTKKDDTLHTHDPTTHASPEVPVWTWNHLIPYTPAIIPAMVGIGLIAFFLWKYFAYLGHKRRRTYRTVRDIPSPPLDDEILQHLQRGELPPPDYGYTMIRDRRRPSAAERRGQRPPRVHKRTIIELHLEVLNECEATEWENVKEDYLHILVEAFARDLMREQHRNNNILGVSTTKQRLSGTCVSSNADRPRHYHARHPTCDAPVPATHTPTCADPKPEITQKPGQGDPVLHIPTCDIVTHTTTSEDARPEITDSPTCDTVTHIPTCADPKPEITQPPGSGNAVTDTPTRDDPKPDITQHTVTNDTVTDTPTCKAVTDIPIRDTVTDIPPHEPPKPAIIHPHTNAPVTDTPTCEDPKPEITDIPTCKAVTDRHTCADPKPEITQHTLTSDTVTDTPTSHTTTWLRWIDRNKHLLRECKGQPWFLQLTLEWKQYLLAHMVANDASGVNTTAAFMDSKKHAWKEWVAKQHALMNTYSEEAWFQHLLNNVEEDKVIIQGKAEVPEMEKIVHAHDESQVPEQQTHVDTDVAREHIALATVKDPEQQHDHYPELRHTEQLTAHTLWMLVLSLIIEECQMEQNMHEKELYVDHLLEQL